MARKPTESRKHKEELEEWRRQKRMGVKKKKEESKDSSKSTPEDTDTVIISKDDIEKIKERAIILTDEMKRKILADKQAEQDRIHAVANQRKQMMLKMEAERKRKSGRLSDAEILKHQNEDRIKENAIAKFEEALDESKSMNRMMNYARCVTIRDGQLHEKGDRLREEAADKMKWHYIMERDRINKIKMYDQIEAMKKDQRYKGADVLRRQMQDREADRKTQEEVKEQEGKRIRRESERMIKEDEQKAEENRIAGKKLLLSLIKANDDAEREKLMSKIKEREDDDKRVIYMHEKDKRDQAYQDAVDKIKHDREMETARLRGLQERAQDKQAIVDELRALRVQEEHEREWREKECAEAEKIQHMHDDLRQAREQQKIFKLKLLADQAREEQIAYYRVSVGQKEALRNQQQEAEEQFKEALKNQDGVLAQINEHREQRARELKEKFEEGERLKQQIRVEKLRLEDIKNRKIDVLKTEGTPAKYLVELRGHVCQIR
ncbi:unnamed protein product [Calypogeia fissa]